MQKMKMVFLFAGLMLVSSSGVLADGLVPDDNFMSLSGDVESRENSGTLTYQGMSVTWEITDFAADIAISGISDYPFPEFSVAWHNTGDVLPFTADIVSIGGGIYTMMPVFSPVGGGSNVSLSEYSITGNRTFGHYFPDSDEVRFLVSYHPGSPAYDMTITMNWGPDVPNDSTTLAQVKCLFR